MQNHSVRYLHLQPDAALPALEGLQLFKAVVVIEGDVPQIRQWEISRWLVSSGCRFMLAWGPECDAWKESVEEANQEAFNYEEIPQEQLVLATSHEDEDLSEVFWFAKHRARHPLHELKESLILHLGEREQRQEMETAFADA